MYTNQISAATQQLIAAGMPTEWANIFQSLLGNCILPLETRGPTDFNYPDPPGAPGVGDPGGPGGTGAPGDTGPSAINVGPNSTINNQGDTYLGGDTHIAGDTTMDGDTINIGGPTSTTTLNGNIDFNSSTVENFPVSSLDQYVKVNSADTTAYLEDQWRDGHTQAAAQYTSGADLLVEVDTVDVAGDKKCRFYVDASDLTGYGTTGQLLLGWDSNVLQVYAAGQVKCSSGDSLAYLQDQFNYAAAIDASADPLVKYDSGSANVMKMFLDMSAISGYSGAKLQMLDNDNGTVNLYDIDAATYSATNDGLVKYDTSAKHFFLDSSAISGWNASNNQVLCQKAGTLQWIDLDTC